MNLWFTSDNHFSHANTWYKFKNEDGSPLRPFTSTPEMNETMVERWNKCVRPNDHVYNLGDVCMMRPKQIKGILDRLKGHLRLVRGNHDIYKTAEYLEWFDEIYGIRVIDNIIFTHIPIHPSCLGNFQANVHGHIHSGKAFSPVVKGDVKQPYINITVEHTDYWPVAFEDLKKAIREAT